MGDKRKLIYEESSNAVNKINKWYERKSKAITIETIPYNSTEIFKSIILKVINSGKNVLYIWGKDCENKELLKKIKHDKKNLKYSYDKIVSNIDFINFNECDDILGKYELAIIDDISHFSKLSKDELRRKYEIISQYAERVIIYNIERVIPTGEYFSLPSIFSTNHFVEPRFLTTRIDLSKDIPYSLYDYLKWFIENKQKVLMYVPDEENLALVCEYYANKLKLQNTKVTSLPKFNKNKKLRDVIKSQNQAMLIITDRIEESYKDLAIGGAIVLFADSNKYNYKQFVYICGEIFRINTKFPEVLLVGKEVSYQMDEAKEIARNFNIKIWESNYLEI